jgi:hypothetical protein
MFSLGREQGAVAWYYQQVRREVSVIRLIGGRGGPVGSLVQAAYQ